MTGPVGGPSGPTTSTVGNPFYAPPTQEQKDSLGTSAGLKPLSADLKRESILGDFPPISDLASIIGILDDLAQTIEESDTQRASLAQDTYSNIAKQLKDVFEQVRILANLLQNQSEVVNSLNTANNIMQPYVTTENGALPSEQNAANAMNGAIGSYNNAATTYETLLSSIDPAPSQASYDSAVNNRDAAETLFDNASADYTAAQGAAATAQNNFDAASAAHAAAVAATATAQSEYDDAAAAYQALVDLPGTQQEIDDALAVKNQKQAELTAAQAAESSALAAKNASQSTLTNAQAAVAAALVIKNQAQSNLNDAETALAPLQAVKDAYDAMEVAHAALISAQAAYNAFVATRNSEISSYNNIGLVGYNSDLNSIQDDLDAVNQLRTESGLAPIAPQILTPPSSKTLMSSSTISFTNTAWSAPAGGPANVNSRTSPSLTIDALDTLPPPDNGEISNLLNTSLNQIFLQIANTDKAIAFSSDVYDFLLNLRTSLNPTKLAALADRQPPPTPLGSEGGASTPGTGVALATQIIGLNSPNLESIMSMGILQAFNENENTPISPDLRKQMQLLMFSILSINSASSVTPVLGRLGIKGLSLSGNSQSVQATAAFSQLENILKDVGSNAYKNALTALLESQPGLSQEQVQNLLDPTLASLNFGTILFALGNLGRSIGAPALPGALLQTLFPNNPAFDLSLSTTTDDIIRNSFGQFHLQQALQNDIGELTGIPLAGAAQIAGQVISQLKPSGNLSGQELTTAITLALVQAGISQADASVLGADLATRISSEMKLAELLKNSTLDTPFEDIQAILRAIRNLFFETTSRIGTAIAEAGIPPEQADTAVQRALKNDIILARDLREAIINNLIQAGATLSGSLSVSNAVLAEIDSRHEGSNLLRINSNHQTIETLRNNVHELFLNATRGDLGAKAEKIADALDNTLFGPTQILPEREKADIRNPISIPNQLKDVVEALTQGSPSRVTDEIKEAVRKASIADFDVTTQYNRANDPGKVLTHTILTGMSGSDAPLAHTGASKPAAPIGKNIDIPA